MLVHFTKVAYINLFEKRKIIEVLIIIHPPSQYYFQQLVSKQVLQKKLDRLEGDPSTQIIEKAWDPLDHQSSMGVTLFIGK